MQRQRQASRRKQCKGKGRPRGPRILSVVAPGELIALAFPLFPIPFPCPLAFASRPTTCRILHPATATDDFFCVGLLWWWSSSILPLPSFPANLASFVLQLSSPPILFWNCRREKRHKNEGIFCNF
jgi:hypothetical protein